MVIGNTSYNYISLSSGKCFGNSDFKDITNALWGVRNCYQSLGIELGLTPTDIEVIQMSHVMRVDDCFYAVIQNCMKNGLYQGDLIKALESRRIGANILAAQLRKEYNFPTVTYH